MTSKTRIFTLVVAISLVSGCASYVQVKPGMSESVTYEQGAPILTSQHKSSTVFLKPSSTWYQKGDRVSFYVGVQNYSNNSIEIDMSNVYATDTNGQGLGVHTYESRMKEIKRAQMWAAIGAGMQAASESMAASQSAYSTSTTTGTFNSYGTYGNTYGTYSGTTTTYDPAKAAAAQAQANANSRARMQDIANATNSAMAQAELLLRRTTLGPDQFHTATLLIDPPKTVGSAFQIAVNVSGEVHVFNLTYEQLEN